mgnify:CR=1 FL=1
MKLQIALDMVNLQSAEEIVKEVQNSIDIIEIGTPFVIDEGIRAVRHMKEAFPKLSVFADLKIMDAGRIEAKSAFKAGADIVSVLGASDDETIRSCVAVAKEYSKSVLVDMIDVRDLEKRAAEIDKLGVDYICVHTAFDVQKTGKNPLHDLQLVKRVVKHAKVAVAGGVKLETLPQIADEEPEIVIVGGGITNQSNKGQIAAKMKEIMQKG